MSTGLADAPAVTGTTYTAREADPSEWAHVAQLAEWGMVPDPTMARVVVVEAEGQVVGAWCILTAIRLEGAWIAPSHRARVGVVKRLTEGVFSILRACEARVVYTAATSAAVERLILKLGFQRFPADWYVKVLGETKE